MTQSQYLIKRKLNIIELGETLGVSRKHYYDIKSAIEEDGLEGLLDFIIECLPKSNIRFWIIPWSFPL